MTASDLLPGCRDPDRSALSDLLARATIYERAGAVIPRDLLQFGFLGSIVVILTGLLALVFPDPAAIRSGDFFLVFGGQAADLASVLHALAVPAIVCGLALLGLDLYLMQVRTSEHARLAIVAQAAAGGIGGLMSTTFLALVILNLALWVAIIGCASALLLTILGIMAGGS